MNDYDRHSGKCIAKWLTFHEPNKFGLVTAGGRIPPSLQGEVP